MAKELKEFEKWMLIAESDLRIIEKDLQTVDPVTSHLLSRSTSRREIFKGVSCF